MTVACPVRAPQALHTKLALLRHDVHRSTPRSSLCQTPSISCGKLLRCQQNFALRRTASRRRRQRIPRGALEATLQLHHPGIELGRLRLLLVDRDFTGEGEEQVTKYKTTRRCSLMHDSRVGILACFPSLPGENPRPSASVSQLQKRVYLGRQQGCFFFFVCACEVRQPLGCLEYY